MILIDYVDSDDYNVIVVMMVVIVMMSYFVVDSERQ